MLFEFAATITLGFAAAGVVMLVNRFVLGRILPRWVIPVTAGAAMLAFTISNEYAWFPRVSAALPPGIVVATANEDSAFWRPWTYQTPVVDRFIAVDQVNRRRHESIPDQVIADVYLFERWSPLRKIPSIFDCRGARRADMVGDGVTIAEDGRVTGVDWFRLEADDPVLRAACAES